MTTDSLKKSPLRALLDVHRDEWPLALVMFGKFFLIIATFWVLKPIKKTLFVAFYDQHGLDLAGWHLHAAQAELIAKVANMVVAAVAVVVFTALSRTLERERLTYAFAGFFAVTLAIYAAVLGDPGHFLVWSFYLLGDLYTTLMVATFFAFLNDSVTPEASKRLYPPIVLGGVAGGAFGSSVLSAWIDAIDRTSWIAICVGTTVIVAVLSGIAGRLVARREGALRMSLAPAPPPVTRDDHNPALAGARLVARSPYLLSIATIVGLYEIVSTLLDFQFTSTVSHSLNGPEIGRQFALVFSITNVAALLVQVFLTSFVMNRLPLQVALLTTPVVIALASGAYLALPVLWVGSMLNTADGAFAYSINQSAKEALYTPTSRDEKYKAKAFIDMFVQRLAKAVAVGVSLLVTTVFTDVSTIRWLSIAVLALAAVWMLAARYGGARFRELTRETAAPASEERV